MFGWITVIFILIDITWVGDTSEFGCFLHSYSLYIFFLFTSPKIWENVKNNEKVRLNYENV